MKIVFRVDASLEIGSGHLMRCLTLAEALAKNGCKCFFVSRVGAGNQQARIEAGGHTFFAMPTNEQSAKLNWESDAKQTSEICEQINPDWLVVDHYEIDNRWEDRVGRFTKKILIIDDLANRPHQCNLLLDGNVVRNNQNYSDLVPPDCELLIGVKYLLLDAQCSAPPAVDRSGTIIFLGGGDNQTDLERLIPVLKFSHLPEPLTVVMGSSQPNKKHLMELCTQNDCQHLIDPVDFKNRCQTSAFAVVRCGLVSYELAALQTPSICFWKPGIHQEVALWLQKNNFAIAEKIDDFLEHGLNEGEIISLQELVQFSWLQQSPGYEKVADRMLQQELV